jgi:hypothetical protein
VFFTFARRLLSVSANSASCERLFSVFGNVLTKLRNRTGNSVIVDLSEVKMHVHDEHINGCETRGRLKQCFEADGIQKSTEMYSDSLLASWHVPSVDEVIDG